ncbi:MAG: hypothetical protein WDM81_20090 [Rhizomicrobium sp.]
MVAFATLAGFTASGILANAYRMVAKKPETLGGRLGYVAVMVVAGPNVLFENAAKSFRTKDCSSFAFWLAASISAYWSFALGMIVIQSGWRCDYEFNSNPCISPALRHRFSSSMNAIEPAP